MRVHSYLALSALLRSRLSLVFLLLAVTAGVAFQIPNAANINGYTEELSRKGLSRARGHLIITSRKSEPLSDVAQITRRIRRLPFVRGITARCSRPGVIFRRGAYRAVRAVGLNMPNEEAVAGFCRQIKAGRCPDPRRPRQAVAGSRLAEVMGLKVGDRIKLVLPFEDLGEVKFASERFELVGVLSGGGSFQEDYDLLLPIRDVYRIMQWDDMATRISVFVDNRRQAGRYTARLAAAVGTQAKVQTWRQDSAFVANAIAGNRALLSISMAMVIVAVGIPVLALLYIHVLHDRRQIATLSALGFTSGDLFWIYLFKAALVGAVGVGLGTGLGVLLCQYFDAHPIFRYQGFEVRPVLDTAVVALPGAVLFVVTLLAGIAPAIRASRANPATELRED